jgi:asparagine synthase (glutamine-hydrolysing)
VKLAFSLPEDLRLTPDWGEKEVLKQAFGGVLPEGVVRRPKQPYRAPDAESFVGENEIDWVREILRPETIASCPIVDTDFATRLATKIRNTPTERMAPRENQAFVLLLSTLLLQREFVDALPSAEYERPLNLVRTIDLRREVE